MNARIAIAAASLASLSLLAPLRATAHDGDPRPVAVLGLNAGAGYGPVVSLGVQIPGAPAVAYAPQPPPVAYTPQPPVTYAPPPPAGWMPPPAPWTPPAAWSPRAVRAACMYRFGPDPWRVSRCEARWLALRPVPGPRWAAAGWPRHGNGHGHGNGYGHGKWHDDD